MPNLTLTIEDTSPLLIYSGSDWTAGSSQNDTKVELYSQSSYMGSDIDGATVFFVFYGTGVQLTGAKRSTHGFFQIGIDTKLYAPMNGQVSDPGNFQVPLFSTVALPNGAHTVKLANQGKTWVDLDFITWQTPIGNENEQLIVNTFQDTDAAFTYTPASAWTTPSNVGMFLGGSGHASTIAGSSFQFTFEGDAVSLFGPVGPSGAPYMVQIDNGLPSNYSTNKPFYRPNMMLYHANNLGSGAHTVKLQVLPLNISGASVNLAVDYAEVYTTPSLGGKLTSSSPQVLSTGVIAGISIGAFAVLTLFLGLLLFVASRLYRRRMGGTFFDSGEERRTGAVKSPIQPFNYNSLAPSDNTNLSQTQGLLQTQTSYTSLTSPTTPQLPSSAGYLNASDLSPRTFGSSSRVQSGIPNGVQEITIPVPPTSGKYRPDLMPQLQPPPQGTRNRPIPAALGANQNVLLEGEEILGVHLDDENPLSAPPVYTQEPSPVRTTFYAPS